MTCTYITKFLPFSVPNGFNHIAHLEKLMVHPVLQTVLKYHLTHVKTVPEKLLEIK